MFFKKIDILSPKITFYYKKKTSHSSIISGILTIISFISVIIFGILNIYKCIKRFDPITYFINRYVNDAGEFSLKDPNNFFNYIQVISGKNRSNIEIDLTKIEIIALNVSINALVNQGGQEIVYHWLYGKCDNQTDIKGLENLIDKEILFQSACLKKFYNPKMRKYYDIDDPNFEWPSINHGVSNKNNSVFGTIIKRCFNSSFRLNNIGPCSSKEQIDEYLDKTYWIFSTLNHYVDILTYKNPINTFLYHVTCGFLEDSYIVNNLNFNPGLIKSFGNILYDEASEKNTYFLSGNLQTTRIREEEEFLVAFFMSLENWQQYYERHYKKLSEAFSTIGGYASLFLIIAEWINSIFSRFITLIDTQELITNIIEKNESIYNAIIKTKNINQFLKKKNKKNNNDINIFYSGKINDNDIVSEIFNDEKNINKPNNNDVTKVIDNNSLDYSNKGSKSLDIFKKKKSKKNKFSSSSVEIQKNSDKIFFVNRKEDFKLCDFLTYFIGVKKRKRNIRYYENLRTTIISEETMIQNYLNIYNLLEIIKEYET